MNDELIIDESNFSTYFAETKKFGPKPGQILARYVAKADLIEGEEKGYLIDLLLTNPLGAEMGVQVTQNLFGATEKDAIRVCREIAADLVSGMSKDQVMQKPYSFTFEKFYWTMEEYVPKDDPHWQVIKMTMVIDPEKKEEQE